MLREDLRIVIRKALSLTLIFNSVTSLFFSLSVLFGVYVGFSYLIHGPHPIDTLLLFFVALTSMLNIVPAQIFGRVNIKRILFHHYVYGFLSIAAYLVFAALHSIAFPQIFPFYGSLLLYWGLTLIIDDAPDISPKLTRLINFIGEKIGRIGGAIQAIHLISDLVSAYVTLQISLHIFKTNLLTSVAFSGIIYLLPIIGFSVTTIYGLKVCREAIWIKRFRM